MLESPVYHYQSDDMCVFMITNTPCLLTVYVSMACKSHRCTRPSMFLRRLTKAAKSSVQFLWCRFGICCCAACRMPAEIQISPLPALPCVRKGVLVFFIPLVSLLASVVILDGLLEGSSFSKSLPESHLVWVSRGLSDSAPKLPELGPPRSGGLPRQTFPSPPNIDFTYLGPCVIRPISLSRAELH